MVSARNGIAPSIRALTQTGRPRLMSTPKPGGISIAAEMSPLWRRLSISAYVLSGDFSAK